ncbi:MAG: hypothetical protein GF350_13130 [Chitinivibrionales bacterium]|nr:hypothetical protein [Chitinivibrionales bacterium]
MERMDNLKNVAEELFIRKQHRRKQLAAMPWPEKVKAIVQMQRMVYPIVKDRNKRACIWKIADD